MGFWAVWGFYTGLYRPSKNLKFLFQYVATIECAFWGEMHAVCDLRLETHSALVQAHRRWIWSGDRRLPIIVGLACAQLQKKLPDVAISFTLRPSPACVAHYHGLYTTTHHARGHLAANPAHSTNGHTALCSYQFWVCPFLLLLCSVGCPGVEESAEV